ncbi:MAG: threonylcarbamoyl-AMP synthase [Oscillospiraceae bacterium]|jgi:L-threonylcarbamoyladenylate synthase|nr:threonylcarbamoyl-AMP synthase [Oscillospiraceae bacterium]
MTTQGFSAHDGDNPRKNPGVAEESHAGTDEKILPQTQAQAGETQRLAADNPAHIAHAAELLRAGKLVAIPTETVYGLAANALDPQAVASIFAAKGRPQDNPLIVHVSSVKNALPLVKECSATAHLLARHFWPGPLTIILPKSNLVPSIVSAGLSTVALRVPAHPAALALLNACQLPLAAPSANTSGKPSPTLASHVLDDMDGKIAAVLDGGPCAVGVESTVLSLTSETPLLLRPGGIPLVKLQALLGKIDVSPAVTQALQPGETAHSPGMKYKHYAPQAALTLVNGDLQSFLNYANTIKPDGLLCFDEDGVGLAYGAQNDPAAQAAQLFARLREIDERGWQTVLVRCPAPEGVGLAVYNRLLRAAAFREITL